MKCPCCNNLNLVNIGAVPVAKTFNGSENKVAAEVVSSLFRCESCKLVFKNPKIKNSDAIALYNNSNIQQYKIPYRIDHHAVLKIISQLKPSSVLDFGCYTGDLLSEISEDVTKYGVEINNAAAKLAADRSNGIIVENIESLKDKVDCIVLCDVIEHLDNPANALLNFKNYLNDSGIIVITTGNSDHWFSRILGCRWYYSSNAEHISFINPRWLNWFCDSYSFNLLELKYIRYEKKSLTKVVYDMAKSLLYLISAQGYIYLQNFGKGGRGIPGLSAWRDHLVIVLEKKY